MNLRLTTTLALMLALFTSRDSGAMDALDPSKGRVDRHELVALYKQRRKNPRQAIASWHRLRDGVRMSGVKRWLVDYLGKRAFRFLVTRETRRLSQGITDGLGLFTPKGKLKGEFRDNGQQANAVKEALARGNKRVRRLLEGIVDIAPDGSSSVDAIALVVAVPEEAGARWREALVHALLLKPRKRERLPVGKRALDAAIQAEVMLDAYERVRESGGLSHAAAERALKRIERATSVVAETIANRKRWTMAVQPDDGPFDDQLGALERLLTGGDNFFYLRGPGDSKPRQTFNAGVIALWRPYEVINVARREGVVP